MNEAMGNYRRWQAAEASERDDDADAAFQSVFESVVPERPISLEFTTRTMTAVAETAAIDARRTRQARTAGLWGAIAATVAAVYVGGGWAVGFISAAFVGLLNLLLAAVVRTVEAFQTGAGVWGVLSSLGQAASAVAADPTVTFGMIAISAVAIAALVALQRLLGSDEESFQ
jgi:hypothetical protein